MYHLSIGRHPVVPTEGIKFMHSVEFQERLAAWREQAAEQKKLPPRDNKVANWRQSGEYVLRGLVCWIQKDSRSDIVRSTLQRLDAGHMTVTEDLILFGTIQSLANAGQELTLERIRNSLAENDPAEFVQQRLDAMTRANSSLVDPDEMNRLVVLLVTGREKEQARLQAEAAVISVETIEGRIGPVEGAELLTAIGEQLIETESWIFAVFSALASGAPEVIEGRQRQHWNAEALAKKDQIRRGYEESIRVEMLDACHSLLGWLGSKHSVDIADIDTKKPWWRFW